MVTLLEKGPATLSTHCHADHVMKVKCELVMCEIIINACSNLVNPPSCQPHHKSVNSLTRAYNSTHPSCRPRGVSPARFARSRTCAPETPASKSGDDKGT
jgi:hypothetical protein